MTPPIDYSSSSFTCAIFRSIWLRLSQNTSLYNTFKTVIFGVIYLFLLWSNTDGLYEDDRERERRESQRARSQNQNKPT